MSGIKEHYLDQIAKRFSEAGFAVLVFDNRNWGESDGNPRHHTNQYQQILDTHDVINFAAKHPEVDPNRIALWGSSFSGGVEMMVGAVDPWVKSVITQVPFVSGNSLRTHLPHDVITKIFSDRGETTAATPTYIPIWPESLEQSQYHPYDAMMGTEESWHFSQKVKRMGPAKQNTITPQTLFHAIRAEPSAFATQVSKPFFMTIASKDTLIDAKLQQQVFDQVTGIKQVLKLDCGHFDVYDGAHGNENLTAQISFLNRYL